MERGKAVGVGDGMFIQAAEREGRDRLLESEVYGILGGIGIATPVHFTWDPETDAVLPPQTTSLEDALRRLPGDRVVLKIQSPDILHKTEAGGIAVCPKDPGAVRDQGRRILAAAARSSFHARMAGILVCERIDYDPSIGHELLMGWRRDRAFGPVLFLGPGGVLTEWFDEITGSQALAVVSAAFFDRRRARAVIERHPVLKAFVAATRLHPRPPVDIDALLDLLERMARADLESMAEIEVNPLVGARDGRLVALDGIGRIGRSPEAASPRPLEKIRRLLYPKSAVVLGASAKDENPGGIILRNLKAAEGLDYGHLYAVHPSAERIDGVLTVPSLDKLPEKVDLAVVALPAERAAAAIQDIALSGSAESIILIPGGFGERGRGDLTAQIKQALSDARRSAPSDGPVLIGGNCLGVVSRGRFNTFFLPQYKLPFRGGHGANLAAISQSGAYLVTLTSNLDGIIFPKASISYGNEMDLTSADFLEYYTVEEPDVRILACYIEGFQPGDGVRFLRLARELAAQDRSLIVFKAGKTPEGARAAQSHTASMAGDYRVGRALLDGEGAVVCESLNQFEDYVKIFTMLDDRRPAGHRVAVISNAGFECSAVLDRLYALEPAALSPETVLRLRDRLPAIANCENPVDTTPMARTEDFIGAVETLLEDPGVDALIVSAVPVTPALEDLAPSLSGIHSENIYSLTSFPQELIQVFRRSQKPMVAAVDSGRLYDPLVILLQRAGIPVYRKIDRASRALSCFCKHRSRRTGEVS